MLTIFRRHSRTCPHTSRTYRRCSCHIHVEGSLGGELIRKALDLTSWTAAVKLVRKWEEAGRIGAESQVVQGIEMAVAKYLDGKRNKKLAESTIYKLRNIFEKQLLGWAKARATGIYVSSRRIVSLTGRQPGRMRRSRHRRSISGSSGSSTSGSA